MSRTPHDPTNFDKAPKLLFIFLACSFLTNTQRKWTFAQRGQETSDWASPGLFYTAQADGVRGAQPGVAVLPGGPDH